MTGKPAPTGEPQWLGGQLRRRLSVVDQVATWGEMEGQLLREAPILVFSLGKTGTSSLEDGLRASTTRAVVKAHNLSWDGIGQRIAKERQSGRPHPHFLWRSQAIRADMVLRRKRVWDVISVMRDPLARSISAYFYSRRSSEADVSVDPAYHGPLVEAFSRRLLLLPDWFSAELRRVTGIDTYAVPYPFEAGLLRITTNRWHAYITRTEDLAGAGPQIIEAITSQSTTFLPRSNVQGDDPAYAALLESWRFDRTLLDEIYSTRAVRHFYRPAEIEQMRSNWCG